ncbi:MAG: DUF502 domain-containing protein [Thiohalorhabdaceae bacterium]
MRLLTKTALAGLATLLPVLATLYLVYWGLVSLESGMASIVRQTPLAAWYVPGVGVATGVAIVFLVGLLMRTVVARRLWAGLDTLVCRIPVVRSIYGALHDLTGYFAGGDDQEFRQVVEIRFKGGARLLGFLTRDQAPAALTAEGEEAVVV